MVMTTCQAHGAAGFTNLLVTKEGEFIVLNPHVENCCVLRLDEQAATEVYHLTLGGPSTLCMSCIAPSGPALA